MVSATASGSLTSSLTPGRSLSAASCRTCVPPRQDATPHAHAAAPPLTPLCLQPAQLAAAPVSHHAKMQHACPTTSSLTPHRSLSAAVRVASAPHAYYTKIACSITYVLQSLSSLTSHHRLRLQPATVPLACYTNMQHPCPTKPNFVMISKHIKPHPSSQSVCRGPGGISGKRSTLLRISTSRRVLGSCSTSGSTSGSTTING
jgi:hypothetical protein